MRLVIKDFFCIKTKKNYKKGDIYDGDRADLSHVLGEKVQEKKDKRKASTRKGAINTK